MPDLPPVTLRNRRQQPVELHLPAGVLVLPPSGQATVPAACLEVPQVVWLLARKLIDTAQPDEPAEPVTTDETAATEEGAALPAQPRGRRRISRPQPPKGNTA